MCPRNPMGRIDVSLIRDITVESRFLEPPRGNKNWFEKSGVREIEGGMK